jgi:hypothetical protein
MNEMRTPKRVNQTGTYKPKANHIQHCIKINLNSKHSDKCGSFPQASLSANLAESNWRRGYTLGKKLMLCSRSSGDSSGSRPHSKDAKYLRDN